MKIENFILVLILYGMLLGSIGAASTNGHYTQPNIISNEIDQSIILKLMAGENLINMPIKVVPGPFVQKNNVAFIEIKDFKFVPDELDVPVGTTVVWINNDWTGYYGRQHMIVAHYNIFRSPKLSYGEEFNFTFTESGRYTYVDPLYKGVGNRTGLKMRPGAVNVD